MSNYHTLNNLIAIDYETWLIGGDRHPQPNTPFPKPICLSYYDGQTEGLLAEDEIEAFLTVVLESKTIIAHNAVFEWGVTLTWYPNLAPLVFKALRESRLICTKIIEELQNNKRKKPWNKLSLAALVETYFKEDISADKTDPDAWRLRYSELDGVPLAEWPEKAKSYAIDDSIWAYKVWQQQQWYKIDYKGPTRAAVALNIMSSRGMRVNKKRTEELEKEIYDTLEPRYAYLVEKGFMTETKGKRPRKNMKILREFIKAEIKEPKYTMKGNIATDKEALLAYSLESDNKVFKYFIEINQYDKIITAYTKNLKVDLVRSQYSATKSTGRSSSFGTKLYPSVNIQQMPRAVAGIKWDVRNCFEARPGYKLVSIDYAGLELASAAHQLYTLTGRSKMRQAINEGNDMHSLLACKIMSMKEGRLITYDEFVKNKKEKLYAEYRQLCKAINLGFPGGIGYSTMRHILLQNGVRTQYKILQVSEIENVIRNLWFNVRTQTEGTRVERLNSKEWALVYDELVEFKKAFLTLYPELDYFLKTFHKRALTGDVKKQKNEFGEWEDEPMYRYKVKGFVRDNCTYTAYCNGTLMQSPSAIGATTMMSEIIERYWSNDEVNPLAFIHDEILFEVKNNDNKYKHVEDISYLMIDEMQKVLPSVRITVEAEMMDYWMKAGGEWSAAYTKGPVKIQY